MHRSIRTTTMLLLVSAAMTAACAKEAPPPPAPPQATIEPAMLKAFPPLPDAMPAPQGAASNDQVQLGRMLFFEPRLSKNQKISCNTCHDLTKYGVDGEPTSDGHKGQKGDRNSPTVYNAAGHFAQFWDGRAADVEAQAKGPVLNPVEMAMPGESRVVEVLESMPEYVDAFKRAFPGVREPITYDNMAKAIGAFERKLMTPSRWDALLKGDQNALTLEEKIGFRTFVDSGCSGCHSGALLGGSMYQRMGVVKAFARSTDPGRMKVTHAESDRAMFKVPSLRNVEKTGPYLHDGKTATLQQAVREMGEYQLGVALSDQQTKEITDFLNALTGTIDLEYIKPPVLPKSTAKTPKAVEKN